MPNTVYFRPADFPNQLGLLPLSSADIINQVRGFRLEFIQIRDEKVERGIHFPPFIKAFYNCIYRLKRMPNQEEYYNFYLGINRQFFLDNNFEDKILLGLKARVYRTYPSLVRDFHFNKLLSERVDDCEIVYNSNLDIEHDIDTLLIKDGNFWAACLFTETRRANIAREWKESRHERFANVRYIEIPVNFDDDSKIGDFFLYGDREIHQLINCVNNNMHS